MVNSAKLRSMTGFATRRGEAEGASWAWELRGVNGRGLDLRLRLPEGIDGLEPALRAALSKRIQRGNVTLGLRLNRQGGEDAPRLNPDALRAVLTAMRDAEAAAREAGVVLAASTGAEVLALRGVMETGTTTPADSEALRTALLADLEPLLEAFDSMRTQEGAALARLLGEQLDQVAGLAAEARSLAGARRDRQREALREALARVLAETREINEARLEQELALIAVKTDVTEELDRLDAHVAAARAHLAQGGAVGRKLDFLMQEFNREANTLCSKAQSVALTRVGLDLKSVIDQMREQIQNME